MLWIAILALTGFQLSACAVGPRYAVPDASVPTAFRNAQMAPAADGARWWLRFNDPVLDSLIGRAVSANLDVRQAAARVRQARAQAVVADARAQPSLIAAGQTSRTELSNNSSIAEIAKGLPTGGPIGLPGSDITTFQTGLDASWELDLFDGVRSGADAARAREAAAGWTVRDVEVSLAAEVARAYFQHRLAQTRLALVDQRLAEQRDGLRTIAVRVRNGLTTSVDQRRGEQRLSTTDAAREALLADREAQLQALAVLLDEPAAAIESRLTAVAAPAAPAVPAGLPSELLRRRPDIRAAERRLAAATSDIGAATADLYPKLTLTGGLDLVSTSLSTLFTGASFQPSAAARLAFPLLDGGARKGALDLRKAQRDEAYDAYQGVVLNALRDVEVALARLAADRRRLVQLAAAEAASRDAEDTAAVQQRAGLIGDLDVLAARDDRLTAQDVHAQGEAQVRLDIVALNKALGGGWTENDRSER